MKNNLTHVVLCDTHTHTHTHLQKKGGAWLKQSLHCVREFRKRGEWYLNHSLGDING